MAPAAHGATPKGPCAGAGAARGWGRGAAGFQPRRALSRLLPAPAVSRAGGGSGPHARPAGTFLRFPGQRRGPACSPAPTPSARPGQPILLDPFLLQPACCCVRACSHMGQTHLSRRGTGQWLWQEPQTRGDCPWLLRAAARPGGQDRAQLLPQACGGSARGRAQASRPCPRRLLAPAPPAGAGCPQAVRTSARCPLQAVCAAPADSPGSTSARVLPLCCCWHRLTLALSGNSPQGLGRGFPGQKSPLGPVLVDQPLQGRGTPRACLFQPEPQPGHRSCALWLCQTAGPRCHEPVPCGSVRAGRLEGRSPRLEPAYAAHGLAPPLTRKAVGQGRPCRAGCRRRDLRQFGEVRQRRTAGEEQMCCSRFRKWKK